MDAYTYTVTAMAPLLKKQRRWGNTLDILDRICYTDYLIRSCVFKIEEE